MSQSRLHRSNAFDFLAVSVCLIFAFICFYPMWYVFIVSITPYDKFIEQRLVFFPPIPPTFKHYAAIIFNNMFTRAMSVSLAKTSLGATGALIITSMLAYGVSKKHVRGMKLINFAMIFTMFFSGGLIPFYLLLKDLQLLNRLAVMIVPYLVSIGHFIIMRNYFSYAVPPELEDAAAIDGANEVLMFFRIIIPISKPMLAAIFLFEAVNHWNDYYSYLVFAIDRMELQPFIWLLRRVLIQPNIAQQSSYTEVGGELLRDGNYLPPASLRMTTIVVAMLPIMLLYPFLQKHFAKGILIGAVKE